MFQKSIDDRLSSWADFRASLDTAEDPVSDTWEFWKEAPYIPYNNKVDPYYQKSWPSPWEIIVDNKYDDFTKAVMIAYTLKLTKRFNDSKIEIRSMVDKRRSQQYNVVCVEDKWVINYNDNGPISIENLPDSFFIENIVEVSTPR